MILKIVFHERPKTANRMYRKGKGARIFLSTKHKGYKAGIAWAASEAITRSGLKTLYPWAGPVSISIDYFFADRRRRDCNNFDKPIFDALNGVVYKDDAQVGNNFDGVGFRATFAKYLDRENPRVEIIVDTEPRRGI